METEATEITALLRAHREGDAEALHRLVELVYPELRRLAHRQLAGARRRDALDTTGLVHEAYLKLSESSRAAWKDRGHFWAVAARAMRQILIDGARERLTAKRGGGQADEPLEDNAASIQVEAEKLIAIDSALGRLAEIDPRLTRIVECRYFAGFTVSETAEALDTSKRTVEREWQLARVWLREELSR